MKRLFIVLFTLALVTMANAQSQLPAYFYKTGQFLTNAIFTNAANSTTTFTATQMKPLLIQQGAGFSFTPHFYSTNTAAISNAVFHIQLSADGTNYSTTSPLTYTAALNGTNLVVGYTNYSGAQVGDAKFARLSKVVGDGGTNAIVVTNTAWAWFEQLEP